MSIDKNSAGDRFGSRVGVKNLHVFMSTSDPKVVNTFGLTIIRSDFGGRSGPERAATLDRRASLGCRCRWYLNNLLAAERCPVVGRAEESAATGTNYKVTAGIVSSHCL